MKMLWNFIKTTLTGGFLFLLPLILTLMLLHKAVQTVAKIVQPLARLFPIEEVAGVRMPYLLAVLVLLLVGFLAGLVAKTQVGAHFKERWEGWLAGHIPGYAELKAKADKLEAEKLALPK